MRKTTIAIAVAAALAGSGCAAITTSVMEHKAGWAAAGIIFGTVASGGSAVLNTMAVVDKARDELTDHHQEKK